MKHKSVDSGLDSAICPVASVTAGTRELEKNIHTFNESTPML